eukprot:scaffold119017_cov81-Phaeocystis_antarctica.AAC.3
MVPPRDRAEELHGTKPLIGAVGPTGASVARLAQLPVAVDKFQAQRPARVGARRETRLRAHASDAPLAPNFSNFWNK